MLEKNTGIKARGGKSLSPTRQKQDEDEVMEGEREKHKQLCEEMSFEFTLESVKRDSAALTGLCYSASVDLLCLPAEHECQ